MAPKAGLGTAWLPPSPPRCGHGPAPATAQAQEGRPKSKPAFSPPRSFSSCLRISFLRFHTSHPVSGSCFQMELNVERCAKDAPRQTLQNDGGEETGQKRRTKSTMRAREIISSALGPREPKHKPPAGRTIQAKLCPGHSPPPSPTSLCLGRVLNVGRAGRGRRAQ